MKSQGLNLLGSHVMTPRDMTIYDHPTKGCPACIFSKSAMVRCKKTMWYNGNPKTLVNSYLVGGAKTILKKYEFLNGKDGIPYIIL